MAKDPKNGNLLYHLTSLENLQAILSNSLRARGSLQRFKDVADKKIVAYRQQNDLNGLVPFHFIPGSPFAGVVQSQYPNGEFVYITLKRSTAKSRNFKIIVQHPLSLTNPMLYDYDKGIEEIDWEMMKKRDYSDPICKKVCMAECLASENIQPKDFHAIYCKDEAAKKKIEDICKHILGNIPFYVSVNKWFFKR